MSGYLLEVLREGEGIVYCARHHAEDAQTAVNQLAHGDRPPRVGDSIRIWKLAEEPMQKAAVVFVGPPLL